MRRLRPLSRRPLAVAALLATPLFFVSLLAMSLAEERPTIHHAVEHGKAVVQLGKPSGSTEATIWALALAPSLAVLLVGVLAMYAPWFGTVFPATATFVAAIILMSELDHWAREHTARYPDGVDLIPKSSTSDLLLRGEWEASARRAALEIGDWTIGAAGLAILFTVILHVRARRSPAATSPVDTTTQAAG
ncbi:MAG TPA: hypothetical protein VEH79_00830 [Gaiellaceae bacterium]|nr:hypothetical protein [Gaiellaceae bacterium]